MKLSTVLRGIEDVAREEILRDFTPDSCIASTKVLIRVLRRYGIEAVPVGVRLVLGNRTFTRLVKEEGRIPTMDEAILAGWFTKHGAWSVGVGYRQMVRPDRGLTRDGKWEGHLVAYLPRHNILIDASACQGNRPEHGIELPGVLILSEVSHGLLKGDAILRGELNGCLIEYRPFQTTSYRSAPDWTEDRRVKRAVKAICAHIDSLV
jgi:hypothetical protein